MDSRRRKQLIYGGAFIAIVALIAWGISSAVRPAPSCVDGIQNQGETGVDCGGPCAKVCAPSTLTAIAAAGSVQSFATSPGHYTFLVKVANANADFGAQSFDYSIDLYGGASDTLMESIPGQSFIYGGQVKYLLVPNLAVAAPFTNAELTVAGANWTPSSTMGAVPQFNDPLPVTGNAMTSSTIIVNGSLTDDDVSAFNNILIVAVFKDANGNVVGASQTELDSIAPGQTEPLTVSYPATPSIDPALTELDAYALR
jgi:hypothetical protein